METRLEHRELKKKINLTINIENQLIRQLQKTFNFRIVDANKNKVADVTITTDANGVGSTSYTIKDAKVHMKYMN